MCPLECSSTIFNIEKSFATYPSRDYDETLKLDPYLRSLYGDNIKTLTDTVLEQSLLGLEIYFNDIEYTSITEAPSVTIEGMVANIGGTLGLFIGISLLSFMEICEILIEIATIIIKNKFHMRHLNLEV